MKTKTLLATLALMVLGCAKAAAQDTLWVKYDNRFTANKNYVIRNADSLEFRMNDRNGAYPVLRLYNTNFSKGYTEYRLQTLFGDSQFAGTIMFGNPGRILWHPSTYSGNNYMDDNSRWSFSRSMESEHFVVFWEKGFGSDPTKAQTYRFNPKTVLQNAEKIWDTYVTQLGFLVPGRSTTDTYKIQLYVLYQSEWRADASGVDGKMGIGHMSAGAIGARGGHTVAHEIGHTFQYLVSADLGQQHGYNYGYGEGASGGNGWWESCANWQAYKVYPERQFTDGEYFEGHLPKCHLNLLHEDWRYENCFVQDYWCMKHGQDFIGRLWRESNKPEDPVETYKRLNKLSQDQLCDEFYEGFARMATWDIDGIRDRASHRIGQHQSHLTRTDEGAWRVDAAYCPQNYGYNIINLNAAAGGTVVKAHFKGIAGADGYRKINVDKAGWRYGFVAYTQDGQTVYGETARDKEGTATLTLPDGCQRLFFVVMGAPTEHWRHPWDENAQNDEQWPYEVTFEGTDLYGQFPEYPADYERRDTTVYINAELAYDGSNYTSTRVQYDMAAISQALGLSTQQLKSLGRTSSSNPRFVGVDANGTIHTGTTTSTSSSTCYGHWFTAQGNVCNYDSSARIFAELYPDTYNCYVGQYPGRLTRGHTYTIRQAVQYLHDGKRYTATMVVQLKIK
ncbi:MAG: DUF4859 domain-containing protein [Prevotella sp.]|nr:DUF4859 domain-containing protein [Prevotella sp.]